MPKPYRVGLNARCLSSDRIRGFARHTLSLIRAMEELERAPEIHLFSDLEIAEAHRSALSRCKAHIKNVRPHLAWEQMVLPADIALSRVEVFHSTTNVGLPALLPVMIPKVITVHDLITVKGMKTHFPQTLLDVRSRLNFEASWMAARTADAIITVSHYSAEQIRQMYPRLEDRVHVIHNGVEPIFRPGEKSPEIAKKYGLRENFFLYVGGFEDRKNVAVLLEAFKRYHAHHAPQTKEAVPGALLALVGDYSEAPPLLRRISETVPGVVWLGYLDDEELIRLYQNAYAAIVPSKDEGFGFQVLEAMACGAAVFSSNATSLPEVGGDAVEYFKPNDPTKLAHLIERALQQPAWVQDLATRGLARSREFTWRRAAEHTLSVYHSLTGT